MKIYEFMARLKKIKLVPVIKLYDVKDALPLGEALIKGDLPIAEVTFRTEAAEKSIRALKCKLPELFVGAGTVINEEQAKRAIDAGAHFIVSPGLNEKVINYAQKLGVPVLPGCCTPSEIMKALDFNLSVVKFFPSNIMGGIQGVKALAQVFPTVRFMPTGGVNSENLLEFLSYKPIIACGGSWMVNDAIIREGNFERISELTQEAVKLIKSMEDKETLK